MSRAERAGEKRRLAAAITDTLNARDFEALAELPWHPDMEFHSRIAAAEGGVYRGIQGLREWAAAVDQVWDGFRLELVDVVEVDDERAVVVMQVSGRARISGAPLAVEVAQLWTWRSGRLWRNVSYGGLHEALEAVGLHP